MFQQHFNSKDPDPHQGGVIFKNPAKSKNLTVLLLTEQDIPAIMALQEKVWASLEGEDKHFLKLRSEDDLKLHLSSRMPIIGVKDENGTLVGQCLVSYPVYADAVKNLEGYPIQGHEPVTAIVQSLSVDPDHTGKGISQIVLDTAKELAAMTGHLQVYAKISDKNRASQRSFVNASFEAAAAGLDPKQGYPVTYWKYSIYQGCAAASPEVALVA